MKLQNLPSSSYILKYVKDDVEIDVNKKQNYPTFFQ